MKPVSDDEVAMAQRIRRITGKKLRTCIFCVRYEHSNYQKALELCSNDTQEGGRQSL